MNYVLMLNKMTNFMNKNRSILYNYCIGVHFKITNMNNKALLFSIIILVSFFFGCSKTDECHNTIMLKNSSDKTIYYVNTLQDGFFNFDPTNENYAVDLKLKPGDKKKVRIGLQLSCWEQVIANAGGYLYIYIYDAEYLEKKDTDWQEAKNKHIKKYALKVKDLQKMNWEIDYK